MAGLSKKLIKTDGSTASILQLLNDLIGVDEEAVEEAYGALFSELILPQKWNSSTKGCLEILLDGVHDSRCPDLVLLFIAELMGPDHVRAWLENEPCDEMERVAANQLVQQRRQILYEMLLHADASVRAAATVPLALLPADPQCNSELKRLLYGDAEAVVRASSALALGRLDRSAIDLKRLKGSSAIVAGAAALSQLAFGDVDDSLLLDGLLAWMNAPFSLKQTNEAVQFPWFGGAWVSCYRVRGHLSPSANGFAAVIMQRELGDVFTILESLIRKSSEQAPAVATQILLKIGGFERASDTTGANVLPFEELSSTQQLLARIFGDSCLHAIGGNGLPAAGSARRRWCGMEAPGVLEQIYVDESKEARRGWQIWLSHLKLRGPKSLVPAVMAEALTGAERWRALVEISAGTFTGRGLTTFRTERSDQELIEQEVAQLLAVSDWRSEVEAALDDLLARFTALRLQKTPLPVYFPLGALLFLPLARGSIPIKSKWESLLYIGGGEITKEILLCVKSSRRKALVLSSFNAALPHPNLQKYLEVLPFAGSVELGRALLKALLSPQVVYPRAKLQPAIDVVEAFIQKS